MWRTASPPDGATHPVDLRSARAARIVIGVTTVLFLLLICRWRPWDLFARGGYSSDFYDAQARAFLHGRISVDPAVAGIEGFLIDGRTYLYYGPFLALVRLPFALIDLVGGNIVAGRLTRVSMVAGFAVLCTGAFHLVEQARHRLGAAPSAWRSAGFVAAVACSPALYLTGWVSVYHETELWAAAGAVWTVVGALRFVDRPSRRTALFAGAAAAATILTRATVGIGIAAGLGAVALWFVVRRPAHRRSALMAIGGCAVGFIGHITINIARFGTPLGLPVEHQVLTLQNPTRAAWFTGNDGSFFGTRFLSTTVTQYLRPDTIRFERLVPVVRFGPPAVNRGPYPLETITPSASLTASATVLCVAALVGLVMLVRHRLWDWVVLTGGAVAATVPTFAIGFIANRYLVDMLPMLLIPAAAAFAAVRVGPTRRWHRVVRVALIGGVLWGAWVNGALAIWTQNLKEPGFTAWRYQVDDLLFGNPAPGITIAVADAPVPRDGVVGLAVDPDATPVSPTGSPTGSPTSGPCDAVYIAEQGHWVPLERANGGYRSTGTMTLAPGTTTAVGGGETWQLNVTTSDDTISFGVDGEPAIAQGEPVAWDGGPVEVTVIDDPISHEFSVTVNATMAMFSFQVPAGRLLPSASFALTEADTGETLCRQLAARR